MMDELKLTVASWADREDLVVEIESGDEDFGLVTYSHDSGEPMLEIYPRQAGGDWCFRLEDLRAVLTEANDRIKRVTDPLPTD
jgi:hypothetical protein